MCLYVDCYVTMLSEGERKARKEHHCDECSRTIEPNERYRYWCYIDDEMGGGFQTSKMCPHCWGTIETGSKMTGCPKTWWWEMVHDLDPEVGFVGNILYDDEHHLTPEQETVMHRAREGRLAQWRQPDGTLWPIPEPVEA